MSVRLDLTSCVGIASCANFDRYGGSGFDFLGSPILDPILAIGWGNERMMIKSGQ
jgi:hypothetical protein